MRELGTTDDISSDDADVAEMWAASGAQWLTDPDVGVPGSLVRRVLGLVGALDERGCCIADKVAARGVGLLGERAAMMGLPRSGRTSCGGASRLMRASDGWIVISLARDDDRELVPAWLELDVDLDEEPWTAIEPIVERRELAELTARAELLGLPCGGVGEVDEGRPVLAERLGHAPSRPIDGAVVVNLAALWAGPLCADLLARLGARVVTVESTRRPDGGRLARRFFSALHGRSESVALDLGTNHGRATLRHLLLASDVVIEGSRPRALEQMGIDAANIVRSGPRVWLSITALGRAPDVRHRVGFGDDAAATGGLVGWVADEPRFVADAVADPLTGLTAAHAAMDLMASGDRWLADVSLARTARSVGGGWLARRGPSERPRPRTDRGAAMPLGRDTDRVLRDLGVA